MSESRISSNLYVKTYECIIIEHVFIEYVISTNSIFFYTNTKMITFMKIYSLLNKKKIMIATCHVHVILIIQSNKQKEI